MLYYLLPALGLLLPLLNYGYGSPKYNDFVQVTCTIFACIFLFLNLAILLVVPEEGITTSQTVYSYIETNHQTQLEHYKHSNISSGGNIPGTTIADTNYPANYDTKNVDKSPTCGHCGDDPVQISEYYNYDFKWPAKGPIIEPYSSEDNIGINIALPAGTPITAADGGEVAYADEKLPGYGKMILIRHPNGFVSAYAHNSVLNVLKGDKVKKGQIIAKSGQSGNASSPQLHFELRRGSTPVDTLKFMPENNRIIGSN